MVHRIQNISIIGDGGWGTTLAIHLSKKRFSVRLWGPFPEYLHEINRTRLNNKFLPGIKIPNNVNLDDNLKSALSHAELIVLAVPSQYILSILNDIKKTKTPLKNKIILSVIKGVDTKSLLRMSQIIERKLGRCSLAVLSGPTIAGEVARGIPTTAVISSRNIKINQTLQRIFNSKTFRIYTNTDVAGVELGGCVKNIIAIACGVCDGLGFGSNTKAAILTRGLAEMTRLGKKLGAQADTFAGLTGLGDLVTTSVNPKSRNRSVGEALGKGKSMRQILDHMEMVAEGVENAKAIYKLSRKLKVPMPICNEVYNILYRSKKPLKAVNDLMNRKTKAE